MAVCAFSIATLKRKLAEAQARRRQKAQQVAEQEARAKQAAAGAEQPSNPAEHVEAERILTQEDFDRIKCVHAYAGRGAKGGMVGGWHWLFESTLPSPVRRLRQGRLPLIMF